jgi:8-oxo-dGTP diphosphatase
MKLRRLNHVGVGTASVENSITTYRDLLGEAVIRIAAAVVVDEAGRTLLVRKRGTKAFMQPGGKISGDEPASAALIRELKEELGCDTYGEMRPLGRFSAAAVNEPDSIVEAELFAVRLSGEVVPAAEIEEAVWLDVALPAPFPLAPLTRDYVLPLVRRWAAG